MSKSKSNKAENGFVTLVSVLIVGAVMSAIATTLLLQGVIYTRSIQDADFSEKAKAIANACAERALEKLRESSSYSGTENLSLWQGSCSVTVINSGLPVTINSSGSVNSNIRKVKIIVDVLTPNIHLSSWQEVSDF